MNHPFHRTRVTWNPQSPFVYVEDYFSPLSDLAETLHGCVSFTVFINQCVRVDKIN